ncbi:MAG: hypothetical protein ABH833_04670 [Parcubacteria group bacterium]
MSLSKEHIQEFKDLLEKKKGEEVSWEEAEEGAHNLTRLAELMYDCWLKDERRKKRLEENPKGFHLEGIGYSCSICGGPVSNEESWYDKWGIKCLICQKAIYKKIIPASCSKNKDSWYSKYDLESRFNINHHAMRRFIKEGVLKPRIVPNSAGKSHVYLFLTKDNKDTLPPKKLTESQLVKNTIDGKEWVKSEPWYKFKDPKVTLKDYKIMEHLRVVDKNKV